MREGAPVIARELPEDAALSFDLLKAEMIACVQELSGGQWTDFNAHDPGITIIEQLCYALTDLGYRASFPVADLLSDPAGTVDGGRFGPHPAWRALPSAPVTIADFRRLLLDRVAGVGNVWITARPDRSGLYDIIVQPAASLPGAHGSDRPSSRRLAARVRRMFLHHRPLGEDISTIRVLRPLRVVVGATLHLNRSVVPEAAVAAAIYRLTAALTPEPRRTGLPPDDAMPSPDALFDGPLPLHGIIADAQLVDRPAALDLDQLPDRLAVVPGVVGVKDVVLWEETGEIWSGGRWPIPDDHYCSLDAGLHGAGPLPIQVTVGGRPRTIDRHDVARRLAEMWASHRERHAMKAAYRTRFALPVGRPRDLTRFTPLASQFPRVYGLGDGHERPSSVAAAQLSGFLSIFELMMLDYCDRLSDLGSLVAGRPIGEDRIGSQALRARMPALAYLSPPTDDRPEGVEATFARLRMPPARHEALLDGLLALYGEDAGDVPVPPPLRPGADAAIRYRIDVKRSLLRHVTALAGRRGRGGDYRSRSSVRRLAGIELRTRILLGDYDVADQRRRQRIAFVEHVLLRQRLHEDGTPTRAAHSDDRLAITAIVHLPRAAGHDPDYRRQVETLIRDRLPAHLRLTLRFVGKADWRAFHRRHALWCQALRLEEPRAIDWCSAAVADLLSGWSRRGQP